MRARSTGTLLAAALLAAAVGAQSDPWRIREVNGAEIVAGLTLSEKSYAIVLCEEVDEDAAGPAEVEPMLKSYDQRSVERCRELIGKEDYERAGRILRNLLRSDPANHDARMLQGLLLHRQGKHEEALAALRESLIGNRRRAEAWKILEEVAAALGRRVVRPRLDARGWTKPKDKDGDIVVAYANADEDGDFGWLMYAAARAAYRHEGMFERDFPKGKGYRFTLRELLFALSSAVTWAEPRLAKKEPVAEDLARLVREKQAGRLIPFAFFALYTRPLPARPERDFDTLKPLLERYFDEHIVVPAGS